MLDLRSTNYRRHGQMILRLRAAQGSIASVAVVLELAVPAELGVPVELSQRRPVITNGADLSRQTRVTPRSVVRNGKTCGLTPLHNGRNGKMHWLYQLRQWPLEEYSYSTLNSRGSRVEDKVMEGQCGGRGQYQHVGRTAGTMSVPGEHCTVCRGMLDDRPVLNQTG